MNGENTTTAAFPSGIRCEFCEITFRCDLDVSKHLICEKHIKNRNLFFLNFCNKESAIEKLVPKDINEILNILKLRCVKDLRDLADRGYFTITDEATAKLADEMANVLLRSVIEFESEGLPEAARATFLKAITNFRNTEKDKWERDQAKQVSTQRENYVAKGKQQLDQTPQSKKSPDVRQAKKQKSTIIIPSQPKAGPSRPDTSPIKKRADATKMPPPSSTVRASPQVTPPKTIIYKASMLLSSEPVLSQIHRSATRSQSASSVSKPAKRQHDINLTPERPTLLPPSVRPLTNPQPRIDSDYVPILAKIKVEKIDNDTNEKK